MVNPRALALRLPAGMLRGYPIRLGAAKDNGLVPAISSFQNASVPVEFDSMTVNLSWPMPPADWSSRLNRLCAHKPEVHVWAAVLELPGSQIAQLRRLLSEDERTRADRFRFDLHRNRFIAARALLRQILSRYVSAEPLRLEFAYGPQGKPSLPGSAVEFNLTHSENLALVAVSASGRIGIDVEHVRPTPDAAGLVARFFCARENAAFSRLPLPEQPAAFYNLWTRKEALLKATGEGIGRYLNQVEVTFKEDEPASFKKLPPECGESAGWQLHPLFPAVGYTGAVVISSPTASVQCWRWDWPNAEA